MINFLDFVNAKKQNIQNKEILNEAFKSEDIDKAIELINKLLSKHIEGLVPLSGYVNTIIDGENCTSKQYVVVSKKDPSDAMYFQFNWLNSGKSTNVYSIDFFKDINCLLDGKGKSDLSVYTMGSSIVYFLPIVWTVVSSKNFNLTKSDATKLAKQTQQTNECYIGALKYKVLENLSNTIIKDAFNLMIEANISPEVRQYKTQKRNERNAEWDKTEDKSMANWEKVNAEYRQILDAIKGGATTMEELQLALKHNVKVEFPQDKSLETQEHEDPDVAFKKLNKYVKLVINGLQPSVILCGAPGVGKTYNVKQQLKAAGYHEGHNLNTIKGKCTPRQLYLALYEYQDKGQICMIDDADGLVGPHAPEDVINILKAALDSTSDDEGRLVSYGITGKLLDDDGNPVPKKFYYRGGVIVITNYQAGALDSALRGRSFIQDINFTTEDILNRIKKLMPHIDPENLSKEAKDKAFDYLNELLEQKAPMVLSIRGFTLCAKMFEAAMYDNDWTDDLAKSMIKEQMKLQANQNKRAKY